jgi:nucleoside phosphorylase
MEASAFLKLCEYMNVSSLGVVKGISDFGDSEKGKDPAVYDHALRNTAIALRDWVTYSSPALNWHVDEGLRPQR